MDNERLVWIHQIPVANSGHKNKQKMNRLVSNFDGQIQFTLVRQVPRIQSGRDERGVGRGPASDGNDGGDKLLGEGGAGQDGCGARPEYLLPELAVQVPEADLVVPVDGDPDAAAGLGLHSHVADPEFARMLDPNGLELKSQVPEIHESLRGAGQREGLVRRHRHGSLETLKHSADGNIRLNFLI